MLGETGHQQIVADSIKELLKIQVHHDGIPLCDSAPFRSEITLGTLAYTAVPISTVRRGLPPPRSSPCPAHKIPGSKGEVFKEPELSIFV